MATDPCKMLPSNTRHKVTAVAMTLEASGACGENHGGLGLARHSELAQPEFSLSTLAHGADTSHLAYWARRYLEAEVAGIQSPHTLDAKARDLSGFVKWFVDVNGHGRVGLWMARDTQSYLNYLEGMGRAATSINRAFATLRRFARWVHAQPGGIFTEMGLPTQGIRELTVDEADCRKVERRDLYQLIKAADALVLLDTRKNSRPRRNRAILAMLYYTGLRVSELVALKHTQLQGSYLVNLARKGRARSKGVYLVAECRRYLDEYLTTERLRDDPAGTAAALLVSVREAGYLTRQTINSVLDDIATEASKHRKEKIKLHPHRLRHAFGSEFRQKTGSDTETAAALGHTGLKYVGRYVRKSQDEREAALEEIFK